MTDTTTTPRRRRLFIRITLAALGVLLLISVVGTLTATFPSVAYARTGGGSFERIAGEGSLQMSFHAGYTQSATNTSRSLSTPDFCAHPLQLSSLSILDVSGTDLSRQVAYRLMDTAKETDSMEHVDVRTPGTPLETSRIGDLVLVVEELVSKPGFWFGEWEAKYRVFLGYKPPVGWLDCKETISPVNVDWDISTGVRFFGTPLHRTAAVAEVIADEVDLEEAFQSLLEKFQAAPAVPNAALPSTVDLGAAAEVAAATGLEEEPLMSGCRIGRKGEALWRYIGPDACERIDAARETLEAKGWTVHDAGSRGVDKKTHRVVLRRGDEFAEWIYEENRENALQQESWTSQQLPDGSWGEQEHHVVGPPLPPAIWIHYWHEQSAAELEASMLAAGPKKRAAIQCLPTHQKELLVGDSAAEPK